MTSFFTESSNAQAKDLPASLLASFHGWNLEDATAFAKVLPLLEQPSLHALLSQSPLSRLDFEQPSVQSPIRDVEL